jgi:hypothetical protein
VGGILSGLVRMEEARIVTPLCSHMSEEVQTGIIGPFKALWQRASPNGCVEVLPLRGGDAGIGPLTKAVMGSVDQEVVLLDVQ